jgi:nucleoside-diphosphate kinase
MCTVSSPAGDDDTPARSTVGPPSDRSAQEGFSVSTSPVERTLVLVKPDAVRRGLLGEIIGRFERKGLAIDALVLRTMDAALADRHYADHVDKGWYPPLKEFMTSGPLAAMILSGDAAITVVRMLVGATDGRAATAGTIRGDLSLSNRENLVHASDSPESSKREISLWFPDLG